jgi:6-phosphogluconolactonase
MAALPPGVRLSAFAGMGDMLAGAAAHIADRLDGARAVALTGGNTARMLYDRLAQHPHAASWQGINWFWGDDRFVPADHSDSNAGMTHRAMSSILAAGRSHALPVELGSAHAAAMAYAETLRAFYGEDRLQAGRPLFDLILLVLGPDGHIASLLPGSVILEERRAWTATVQGRDHIRVSLTLPVLESAREIVIIAGGEAKRAALAGWFAGDPALPITSFQPAAGIRLFADAAALGQPALVS